MTHYPCLLILLVTLSAFPSHAVQQQALEQTNPSTSASTQQSGTTNRAADPNRRRSMREIVMRPVVHRVAGMDQVKVQKDVKYSSVTDPNLLMDVYIPPKLSKGERRPAVVFIHGGAGAQFTPKDWEIFVSWGRLVAASGLVGVTFTHRLGYPKPSLAEAAKDVTDAINYIRTNADSLNIDKERICLVAYSAGGPTLSLAMRGTLPFVRCLVAFYAFMDIQQSELHRNYETPEMVRDFSPITHLTSDASKVPAIFIARAGLDEIPTMNDSIDRFVKEAISKNATIDFANHPQGIHGFDNQNDDERSREIIRRVVDFMKIHLGVAEAK